VPIRPNSPTVSSCGLQPIPVDGSNRNQPGEHAPSSQLPSAARIGRPRGTIEGILPPVGVAAITRLV
jgi:hypothetical protein